jgi:hypothetical protein
MANEEHLAILRQGVEVWNNKWWDDNLVCGLSFVRRTSSIPISVVRT